MILYDYTPTRERAGPEDFLKGIAATYRRMLMADMTPFSRTRRAV